MSSEPPRRSNIMTGLVESFGLAVQQMMARLKVTNSDMARLEAHVKQLETQVMTLTEVVDALRRQDGAWLQ